jgi:hypothetical protein
MEIAKLVAKYEGRGFSRERAEINALMEGAVFTIFRDFPDAFLLFGGATLVLFHESLRHSADLDLLARGASLPSREEIINSLRRDLVPVAENLQLGRLRFAAEGPDAKEGRIFGSAQEFDGACILSRFLKNDKFCFCDRHALRLEQ